jgi:hypothetical protein
MSSPKHHAWFEAVQREIAEQYDELRLQAKTDIQRSGHGGEGTWKELLNRWLPDGYEAGVRKYILPEHGPDDDGFETDLIIYNPRYPRHLRDKHEVLAGGVAAAFSCKLTLDSAGIQDAVNRAIQLRRQLKPRTNSIRAELLGAFPVGLLAHSHSWKKEGSTPHENIDRNLLTEDLRHVAHPRETIDLVCVADVGAWHTMRIAYLPGMANVLDLSPTQLQEGYAMSSIVGSHKESQPPPVAMFLTNLIRTLSYNDPLLKPLEQSLRLTQTSGTGAGKQRKWELHDIFSERVRSVIRAGNYGVNGDWDLGYI